MNRQLKQVDTAAKTWAVSPSGGIYAVLNGKWKKVPGRLSHVSSGNAGVWGIMGNRVYYRVMKKRALGASWKKIPGKLIQISSGPRGVVCGVSAANDVYCRLQITRKIPYGRRWIIVPGKLQYISCGAYGHWGVNRANHVFFRKGVSRSRPQGRSWQRIPGLMNQIDAGKYGQVVGVNKRGQMYVRTGASRKLPQGNGWKLLPSIRRWRSAAIGRGNIFAVDAFKTVYKSTLGAVAGNRSLFYRTLSNIRIVRRFSCITQCRKIDSKLY